MSFTKRSNINWKQHGDKRASRHTVKGILRKWRSLCKTGNINLGSGERLFIEETKIRGHAWCKRHTSILRNHDKQIREGLNQKIIMKQRWRNDIASRSSNIYQDQLTIQPMATAEPNKAQTSTEATSRYFVNKNQRNASKLIPRLVNLKVVDFFKVWERNYIETTLYGTIFSRNIKKEAGIGRTL